VRDATDGHSGSYFDYLLIWTIILVVLSGLATEMLHYVRLEPHRHIAYFIHLALVFALLFYLPYSKLGHLVYRTVALAFAEHTGRTVGGLPPETGGNGKEVTP
jgi:quinone-modifying oxidoreductase subunit QmoC